MQAEGKQVVGSPRWLWAATASALVAPAVMAGCSSAESSGPGAATTSSTGTGGSAGNGTSTHTAGSGGSGGSGGGPGPGICGGGNSTDPGGNGGGGALGNVYHVDSSNPAASDANAGTQAEPWRTIQHAADVLVPGDTVVVHSGEYDERVAVTTSGTAEDSRIEYRATGAIVEGFKGFTIDADYITIEGFDRIDADSATWSDGIGVYVNGSYVDVSNCVIRDCPYGGVYFEKNSTRGRIAGNTLSYNGQNGIEIHGSYHLVECNSITRSVQYHREAGAMNLPDADGMRFHGDHQVIRGNAVIDPALLIEEGQRYDVCDGEGDCDETKPNYIGYNLDPHVDGFQTYDDGTVTAYVTFDANYCRHYVKDMYVFMLEGLEDNRAHDITIQNNIFETNLGIDAGVTVYNLFLYNNTFIGNPGYYGTPFGLNGADAFDVRNNITVDFPQHRAVYGGSGSFSANLAWNSDGTTPYGDPSLSLDGAPCGADGWSCSDPQFASYDRSENLAGQFTGHSAWDYHQQAGSPAIDSGDFLATVTTDYEGNVRPQGDGLDRGAYEYGSN